MRGVREDVCVLASVEINTSASVVVVVDEIVVVVAQLVGPMSICGYLFPVADE